MDVASTPNIPTLRVGIPHARSDTGTFVQVLFSQFYIEPGAVCPFNYRFQVYISEQVTALVKPSPWFSTTYGDDWNLILRLSARWSPDENDTDRGVKLSQSAQAKLARYRSFTPEPLRAEVRGPTVFHKDKDVEYSIFVPFHQIIASDHPPKTALRYLFAGVYSVLEKMQIDANKLRPEQDRIVKHICSQPRMFDMKPRSETGACHPAWTDFISKD